jgi:hypothetical protein
VTGFKSSACRPGLTRASILFAKKMDCRVKPGNDDREVGAPDRRSGIGSVAFEG